MRALDPRAFEALGGETLYSGRIVDVRMERFRHADGEEVSREIVRHRGAVGMLAYDEQIVWLVRQPREAVDEPDLLEIPAGRLRQGGRGAARGGQARAGRGDRPWRPQLGADRDLLTRARASPTSRSTCSPRPISTRRAPTAASRSGSRLVPWPLERLGEAIAECRDAKTLIALYWLAARLNALIAGAGAPSGEAKLMPCPSPGRSPRPAGAHRHARSAVRASPPSGDGAAGRRTSWPTWSWSGASRATPWRPTAATCCSSGVYLERTRARPSRTRATPTWRSSSAELAGGRDGPRAGRRDDAGAQGRLPALLLPPPAPGRADRARPDRRAARPAKATAAAQSPDPRGGREPALPAPRPGAPGAARPGAAGGHVCLRAAGLGGRRPRAGRRGPRGGAAVRPGQGLQGADRADRAPGADGAAGLPALGRAGAGRQHASSRACWSTTAAVP